MLTFAQPFLLLLAILPVALAWQRSRQKASAVLSLPDAGSIVGGQSWRVYARYVLVPLQYIALGLLVLALARPQRNWSEQKIKADAIDIMLVMDISPSMLSKDFQPDRLAVAKKMAIDFVEKRSYDRLGLVAFSAEAFTQCPLTLDHLLLKNFIQELQIGVMEDGTAIGMGLATAVNRLKDSATRSKIIIILTDGENNAGYVTPEQATELAKSMGVKIYTIAIGSTGYVLTPVTRAPDGTYFFDRRLSDYDTDLLDTIAQVTQGRFFRAQNPQALANIYNEIDQLEKTKIEVQIIQRSTEYFQWLLGAALLLLLLEFVLRWALLRSVVD